MESVVDECRTIGQARRMDDRDLLNVFAAEHQRLVEVLADCPAHAPVPSCPGWTADDLARHTGAVYLHKLDELDADSEPPWPPDGIDDVPPRDLLASAYAALAAQLRKRQPTATAHSWYEPDQSVRFWIRRMAHETLIHRIDAELAAGLPISEVSDELAADGVDEVLTVFLAYAASGWPQMFDGLLDGPQRAVDLLAGGFSWQVLLGGGSVTVTDLAGQASATVVGTPEDLLLWLWGRGPQPATLGDLAIAQELRAVMAVATA